MKLCQENTELAEKLKSIIDQYELREEVGAMPRLPVPTGSNSGGKRKALPACPPSRLSFRCLVEVTRVAPTTLRRLSGTRHAASLPDPTGQILRARELRRPAPCLRHPRRPRCRGERNRGTRAARRASRLLSCPPAPSELPQIPRDLPQHPFPASPRVATEHVPAPIFLDSPPCWRHQMCFCSLQTQVAGKGSDANALTLPQKQKR